MKGTRGASDLVSPRISLSGANETRTRDPLLAKQVLFQLSYSPKNRKSGSAFAALSHDTQPKPRDFGKIVYRAQRHDGPESAALTTMFPRAPTLSESSPPAGNRAPLHDGAGRGSRAARAYLVTSSHGQVASRPVSSAAIMRNDASVRPPSV
jgi:hypothetical protein